MNCFSRRDNRRWRAAGKPLASLRRLAFALLAAPVMACGGPSADTAGSGAPPEYQLIYRVTPQPSRASASVELELRQSASLLHEVRFRAPSPRFSDFAGDGEIRRDGDRLHWVPPAKGGKLRWQVAVPHQRNGKGHDAWLGKDWGLFRAEDIIPSAATRTASGARSVTGLAFDLPADWSVVTQYVEEGGLFVVQRGKRRFKQPKGWIVMGNLGVRRDDIAGISVTVAGPVDNGVRRLDILALLNWTLPELARIVADLPPRITIVSADQPMWRGGLSAPYSLYIHADRPLLSENGTSTLLHEIMHIALDFETDQAHDWIVEGLAEYYSLELLRRTGTISRPRYDRARRAQQKWARASDTLCGGPSSGATTAKAVSVFLELDREMRRKTDGNKNLDDLVIAIVAEHGKLDVDVLDRLVRDIIGENPDALHIDKLPGCRKMAQL
jgi:hypothetical protein